MNVPGDELSRRWRALARRTVWKVNAAWWAERVAPLWVALGVVGFAGIVWLKSRGMQVDWGHAWPWLACAMAMVLALGWVLARKQFIGEAQALVRLESQLRLHNALSVAALGRGVWPVAPENETIVDGLRWRWGRLGGPLLAAAVCLAAAWWMPVSSDAMSALPTAEPMAWQQMDQWLDKLNEQKIITPEEKKEQAAKVGELRDQEREKWFSHDSLHASDALKEQMQREIQKLGQDMSKAERSLNALQNYADKLSQAAKENLLKEFNEAVEGLKGNNLKMDPQLLKELAEMDPKNLKSMSKEDLDQLRKSLKEKGDAMKGMGDSPGFLGDGEGDDDKLAEMLGQMGDQEGEGDGDDPGNGGASRGPGTAPLSLSSRENRFDTNKREALSNTDMSHAQLGTTLGLKDGKHEVDKTYAGPGAAGAAGNTGQGGEQVWRESLTPEEKAVLKRVFQ